MHETITDIFAKLKLTDFERIDPIHMEKLEKTVIEKSEQKERWNSVIGQGLLDIDGHIGRIVIRIPERKCVSFAEH